MTEDDDPIEAYIRSFPTQAQDALRTMRAIIRRAAPAASEKISYRMPTFYLNGNLVHYAAFARHIGLYPLPHVMESFREELKGYTTGKGSIQFPLDQPLPEDLISRIVRQRIADNASKPAKSRKK